MIFQVFYQELRIIPILMLNILLNTYLCILKIDQFYKLFSRIFSMFNNVLISLLINKISITYRRHFVKYKTLLTA